MNATFSLFNSCCDIKIRLSVKTVNLGTPIVNKWLTLYLLDSLQKSILIFAFNNLTVWASTQWKDFLSKITWQFNIKQWLPTFLSLTIFKLIRENSKKHKVKKKATPNLHVSIT